ncbi:MAG: Ig-like domain-containing protein [Turneriella sp.]
MSVTRFAHQGLFQSSLSIIAMMVLSACNIVSTRELLDATTLTRTRVIVGDPTDGSNAFPPGGTIIIAASATLRTSTLMNITLISAAGKSESFQVTERGNDVYALTPVNGLASATAYVLTIPTAVVDLQGRAIASAVSVSFSTYDSSGISVVSHNLGSVFPEGTTTVNASITFNRPVNGVAFSSTALSVSADSGCLNCSTLSSLSGSGAGPYTFTISGLLSASTYLVNLGSDIKDANGISANTQVAFSIGPAFTLAKNPIGRGVYSDGWGMQDHAPKIATDPSGNIYVGGTFSGTINFGGGNRTVTLGTFALYLAKYDSSGNYLWDTMFDMPSGASEHLQGMVADATGVYLTGLFCNQYTWPGQGLIGTSSKCNGLVAKVNAGGTTSWASAISSSGSGNSSTRGLRLDRSGNLVVVYATNSATSSSTFSKMGALTGCGAGDGNGGSYWLVGINASNGACQWTTSQFLWVSANHAFVDMDFDASNMYVAGVLSGNAYVGRFTYNSTNVAPVSAASYTATGGNSGAWGIVKDPANNDLYVAGVTGVATNFNCSPTPCTSVGSASNADVFLLRIPTTFGNAVWAKSYGGTAADNFLGIGFSNNRIRLLMNYDATIFNTYNNSFGCATMKGIGSLDQLFITSDTSGNFTGGRFIGSSVTDIVGAAGNLSGFSMDASGKIYGALYMGQGKIGSTSINISNSPPDLAFWRME